MKVEFHCHTDRYSQCSSIPPEELVAMAEAAGYEALFITDHNKIWPNTELDELRSLSDRVLIFPAIEITLADRTDVLVLGAEDEVYENLDQPHDVLAQASEDGLLTVVAHPFRWAETLPDYCAAMDAIEIHTCNHSVPEHLDKARAYAEEHHLAPVYSGDSHGLNFMNKFWLETTTSFETAQDFRQLIVSGQYENRKREFSMPLPPPDKIASMSDLSDEDRNALVQPPAELGIPGI
jgi:hypothetical protein